MIRKLGILLCLAVFFSAFALAQDKQENISTQQATVWNIVCPVDGMKVDPAVSTVTYNDKLYGFCSEEDAAKFKADPDSYAANLSEDGTKFIGKSDSDNSGGGY